MASRFTQYIDTDQTFSFKRLDLNLVQHLPVYRETWVVSFRGRVQSTLDGKISSRTLMMPSLGSGKYLRAHPVGDFGTVTAFLRASNGAGYPIAASTSRCSADAGKVVPRTQDLNLKDLRGDVASGSGFTA